MNKIAFLSIDDLEGYTTDDHLTEEPLAELGWKVESVPWRKTDVDWSEFAAVIIRTTWDYHNHLPVFLGALEKIESATRLANPLSIVRWNSSKTYLRELEAQGIKIVPTIWDDRRIEERQVQRWFEELDARELVIKPTVSANAGDTFRLQPQQSSVMSNLNSVFVNRHYMVQPFMTGIVEEGEFSLFYFGGEYSHTILKTPKAKDFRVQEEHGGLIQAIKPPPEMLRAGEKVMQFVRPTPLYARADFVRDGDDLALMELELIEPSLYFRKDENSPQRFAAAVDNWLRAA